MHSSKVIWVLGELFTAVRYSLQKGPKKLLF